MRQFVNVDNDGSLLLLTECEIGNWFNMHDVHDEPPPNLYTAHGGKLYPVQRGETVRYSDPEPTSPYYGYARLFIDVDGQKIEVGEVLLVDA